MSFLILEILGWMAAAMLLGGVAGWFLRQMLFPTRVVEVPAPAPASAPVAPGQDDALRARERERLLAERDRLAAERDRVAAEREGILREHDALGRERDGLARELDETRSLVRRLERLIEQDAQAGWPR
jgi:hypothetical protein